MSRHLLVETLEERVLHSVDLVPLTMAADANGGLVLQAPLLVSAPVAAQQQGDEIVFVDRTLADAGRLFDDIAAQRAAGRRIEAVAFGSGDDALALITQTLSTRSNVAAVHIVSHGADGALQLGATRLDAAVLMQRAGEVAAWRDALTADADLLLYGCDVAAGLAGRAFVADLAALTGADVAASNDRSGAAAQGANWTLEQRSGAIEARSAVGTALQLDWSQSLAVTVDAVNSSVTSGQKNELTWSHSVGQGSNRLLVVQLVLGSTSGATSVMYGGQALTRLAEHDSPAAGISAEIWYLLNPVVDSGEIQVLTGIPMRIVGGSVSLSGVDQTLPFGLPFGASGSGGDSSVLVLAASDDLVLDIAGARNVGSATVGAGQTSVWSTSQGSGSNDLWGGATREAGAPVVAMSQRFSSSGGTGADGWVGLAVAIRSSGSIGNGAPAITSNGGGATAQVAVAENTNAVTTVQAVDPEGTAVGYSIVGGVDRARFTIDAASGALSFVGAPDHEAPGDADGDNVYQVQVAASDGRLASTQTLSVAVSNADEAPQRVTSAPLTVAEESSATLSSAYLRHVDVDTAASQLVYTVTARPGSGAALRLDGAALGVGQAFTQRDIEDGRISVRFFGDAFDTSFRYTLSDGTTTLAEAGFTIIGRAVNDAPTGSDRTITLNEDSSRVLTLADLGFTDPGDSPSHDLLAVHVVSLAGAGSLQLSGTAVVVGQVLAAGDIAAGRLVFTPAPQGNGIAYASLGLRVQDNGGTADGGSDTDASVRTLRWDVTAVNDPPTATVPAAQLTGRDQPLVFSAADGNAFTLADADAGSSARVSLTVSGGTLTLARTTGLSFVSGADGSGAMVLSGDLSALNAALDGLRYTPGAGFTGGVLLTLTHDDQGAGGGAALAATGLVTINVVDGTQPASGAPVLDLGAGSTTYTENAAPILLAPLATVTDADSSSFGGGRLSVHLVTNASADDRLTVLHQGSGAGQIGVFGADIRYGGVVIGSATGGGDGQTPLTVSLNGNASAAAVQALLRSLAFANVSDAPLTSARDASVMLSDGAGGVGGAVLRTVNVVSLNDAPVGAPLLAGIAAEDQVLGVDTTGITDADGLGSFAFQWLRNGVAVAGATAASYTLGDADVGARIAVRVDYSDGRGGAESLTSGLSAAVLGVNDAPTGAPRISANALEDTLLGVDTGDIADADGLGSFSFQWQRDGVAVTGATGSTYLLGDADVGATISVRVAYSDGQGSVETLSSAATATVANVNDAPTGAPQIVGSAVEDGMLVADTSAISDADGLGSFAFQWLRNGAAVTGATAASYTLGDADVGARINVRVAYSDGHGSAETATSTQTVPVANVNDAPTGLPQIVGSAVEDGMLVADTSAISDADGLGSFAFQWLRNGASVTGATAASYTLGDADVGARISVRVAYSDGHGSAEALTSAATATVANANDAPTGTPLIVGNAVEDGTLTVDTRTIADADGSGGFSYQWQRDGVALAGATAGTYRLGDADVGAMIAVRVSYTDGQGGSEGLTSAATVPVANVNDAPALALPIASQLASQGQPFAFTLVAGTFADADSGDAELLTAALADGTALPAWLRFDAGTRTFSGTPGVGDASALTLRITATDRAGASAAGDFELTVSAAPAPAPAPEPAPAPQAAPEPGSAPAPKPAALPAPEPAAPAPAPAPAEAVEVAVPAEGAAPPAATAWAQIWPVASPVHVGLDDRGPVAAAFDAAPVVPAAAPAVILETRSVAARGDAVLTSTLPTAFASLAPAGSGVSAWLAQHDVMRKFDELVRQAQGVEQRREIVMASSVAVTGGISVGYVIWLVRGGVLMSSMLSALPAWQMIDPLPVLAAAGSKRRARKDSDGDDVERLFDEHGKAAPAGASAGRPEAVKPSRDHNPDRPKDSATEMETTP